MNNKCFYCGHEMADGQTYCPSCHRDQTEYRRLIYESDMHYNTGLEKARVRDLTGAIQSLKESLRINKYNTDARNLLGLIFYARGNSVDAVAEWVISKNLQPEDNRADDYLKDVQKPGSIERANQDAEKYNRALEQCRSNNTDLAKLQLKRIVNSSSNDIEAISLLALIYIREKNYSEAKKLIKKAQEIDLNDTAILRYKKEIRNAEKDKNNRKKKKPDLVNFNDGNDNVIMTRGAFRDFTDGSRTAVINIVVGIILGILFSYFLIIPTVRQKAKSEAANSIVNANETATSSQNNASELEKQVKSLQDELAKYTSKSDTVTSYEQLLQAKAAIDGGDAATATSLMESINPDLLQDSAKAMYDGINGAINEKALADAYAAGIASYNSRNYEEALNSFNTVIGIQEDYDDGNALFRLAETYDRLEQFENSLQTYNRVTEIRPDTNLAARAASRAEKEQARIDQAATQE